MEEEVLMEALRRALIGKHNTAKQLLCTSTFGMGGIAVPLSFPDKNPVYNTINCSPYFC